MVYHANNPRGGNKTYSVDRLRSLYANLLRCIDVDSEDLCPRGVVEEKNNSNNTTTIGGVRDFSSRVLSLPRRYARQKSGGSSGGEIDEGERTVLKQQELAAAFRMLAATKRSSDNDAIAGGNGGDGAFLIATYHRTEEVEVPVRAQKLARKLEAEVVSIIREIGEVVVNAERPSPLTDNSASLRDDDTFAYFCEKAILVMLVEIVKDKAGETPETNSCFRGVVWSPKVKAQVFHTVSLLVSGVRDRSALYYILSQHCINQLILSVLPLTQWTDPALEGMLSAYADLLKTLSLQLGGSPELFPFFTLQQQSDQPGSAAATLTLFPLLSAVVQVATSSHAQSDSYVHATCLNLIVGLLRISDGVVRDWMMCQQSEREQRLLCHHLCVQLTERYRRIANTATGPAVDAVRSTSIGGQLAALDDQIDAVNDMFWCNVDVLNVRLCETLLQQFIRSLLRDLLPGNNQKFLVDVGVSDSDVIPGREAAAQAASLVLSRMFLKLEYGPFVRMLAVALFHPMSSTVWESGDAVECGKEYVLLPALNALVQDEDVDGVANVYRQEICKGLSGDYGEWRVVSSASLIENAIRAVDNETLVKLEILPPAVSGNRQCNESALEGPLALFLSRKHSCKSAMSSMSLECASSLATQYLYKAASMAHAKDGKDELGRLLDTAYLRQSSLIGALRSAKLFFYDKTLESQRAIQVNDIVVDLVEAVMKTRYKRCSTTMTDTQGVSRKKHAFACHLSQYGSNAYCLGPEPLTRKMRGVDWNDVEITRFYATMAIHFRAVCRVVDRFHATPSQRADSVNPVIVLPPNTGTPQSGLDFVDEAGELSSMFSCLVDKPPIGTDLDLRGRMIFRFSVQVMSDDAVGKDSPPERNNGDDVTFREPADWVLVLDPTYLFVVVKPSFAVRRKEKVNNTNNKRGTIVCCIPLLDIVAAAADESRLHVAVRHDDVGLLIKNGNMVITFDSAGTCLIVLRYLDKCLVLLRQEMYGKIVKLFTEEAPAGNGDGSSLLDSEPEAATARP